MSDATQNSVKEEVMQMLQRLPEDCTLEDIQYHLFVRARIEQSLATLEDGTGLTQKDLEQQVQEWLKSPGKTKQQAS